MNNVTFVTDESGNEHAIIDHGNEQFTSMPKTIFDEMKSNEATAK